MTAQERDQIQLRAKEARYANTSSFLRDLALKEVVFRLELPELQELIRQMSMMGNNLNQVAKLGNTTGRFYKEDLDDLKRRQDRIWKGIRSLLLRLESL